MFHSHAATWAPDPDLDPDSDPEPCARHAEDVLDSVLPVLGFKPAPSGFDLNGDGRIDFEDFRACAASA